MTKLPLLLHAPTIVQVGPNVILEKGTWSFESNIMDSIVMLSLDSIGIIPFPVSEITLDKDNIVCISVTQKGKEPYLTVYAIKK
jgi:hypothetical protein